MLYDSKIEFVPHSQSTNKNNSISNASPVMRSSAQERLTDALAELANARTPTETAQMAVIREAAENEERLKRSYGFLKPH